jgi:hypothetical protein
VIESLERNLTRLESNVMKLDAKLKGTEKAIEYGNLEGGRGEALCCWEDEREEENKGDRRREFFHFGLKI